MSEVKTIKDDGCRELPLQVQDLTEEEKKEADKSFSRFCELVFNTTQADAEEMFDSGIFNGIAIGYAKIALERIGIDLKSVGLISQFEDEMRKAFDLYTAKEARKVYLRKEV